MLSSKKSRVTEHRRENGFGRNNLEHLADEKGRFDGIDIEGVKQGDFALLANFSNH